MSKIRVSSLDCWHANELIYQAEGRLDDGRHVFVHYRGGRFSVWVGATSIDGDDPGEWIIDGEPRTGAIPDTITRATLVEWAGDRFDWPDRIDGYHNEPGGPPLASGPDG